MRCRRSIRFRVTTKNATPTSYTDRESSLWYTPPRTVLNNSHPLQYTSSNGYDSNTRQNITSTTPRIDTLGALQRSNRRGSVSTDWRN